MYETRDRSLFGRMIRAARLEPQLYEEVERDRNATGMAATVVVIAAVAAAIGLLLSLSLGAAILVLVTTILGWILWSYVTYWVGTTFFATPQTRTSPGEMLRTLGFSHAPGVLLVFTFIPILGVLVSIVVAIWRLIAGVIAVRAAMDFDTGRAIGTVVVGWLITFVAQIILFAIFS